MASHCSFILGCVAVLLMMGASNGKSLKNNFYKKRCPEAEEIVRNVTWRHVATNNTLPAKLLRMHFHDCFVRGCDGSVLLNSTNTTKAEKDAPPNLSLAGFDIIDDIKAELEKKCPGVVSCADIVALAARDSVSFQFQRPIWKVLTGRRDGNVSLASEALANIPSPLSNFTTLLQNFVAKGLSLRDLVVLSGAHTIGVGHCAIISSRLYNFTGKGDTDPSLNSTYAAFLKTRCSRTDTTTVVPMDPNTPLKFDNQYFVILEQHKGLFQSDAALLTDGTSSTVAQEMLSSRKFFRDFRASIEKMGEIGVLTGSSGQIRRICSKVN